MQVRAYMNDGESLPGLATGADLTSQADPTDLWDR